MQESARGYHRHFATVSEERRTSGRSDAPGARGCVIVANGDDPVRTVCHRRERPVVARPRVSKTKGGRPGFPACERLERIARSFRCKPRTNRSPNEAGTLEPAD